MDEAAQMAEMQNHTGRKMPFMGARQTLQNPVAPGISRQKFKLTRKIETLTLKSAKETDGNVEIVSVVPGIQVL